MLTYSFENISDMNLYEYIYKCIKEDVLSGKLEAHTKLPSKRMFAKNHGISVITVESAYGQLMAEGYIYSVQKSGYYVADIHNQIDSKKQKSDLIVSLRPDGDEIKYDFVTSHTLAENFPFSVWAKLMRQELSENSERLLTTSEPGGVFELRQEIVGHLKAFRNLDVKPEQIVVGAGSEYLYGLLIQLLGRDKVYGLEEPGYRKTHKVFSAQGASIVTLALDEEGVRMEGDKGLNGLPADVIVISPSHHFPTGVVMPVSRRYGVLEWANKQEGRYIIEDDYDSEFRLQGKPIPSLMSIDVSDRVIYMNTFTRSLASTIRVGYMVLPQSLVQSFYDKLGFYACTVPSFEQYTLAAFIRDGYFERHINRMRSYYKNVRDRVLGELEKSRLAPYIETREEHAGLHFLMEFDSGAHAGHRKSDERLKQLAKKEGVRITFLSDYYGEASDAEKNKNIAVINYSGIHENDIRHAIAALERAWL